MSTWTSVCPTRAKIAGNASTGLIATAACVPEALPGATARPTLTNAPPCPVSMAGIELWHMCNAIITYSANNLERHRVRK